MKIFKPSINIALSPNNTWRDTLAAFGQLFFPWNWTGWQTDKNDGRFRKELEKRFGDWIDAPGAVLAMGSGREALYLILKAIGGKEGDEIILQSFTCMVVVNAIIWAGYKPVFVDVDDNFNLDKNKIAEKINKRTKAIMIQHTFGIPADVKAIKKICQENQLLLIEDCAHAMGATVDGQKVGTFGDWSFFSLGRSKVISCVSGGLLVCNDTNAVTHVKKIYSEIRENKRDLIVQNLLHPLIVTVAKYTYNLVIGKGIMVLAQKAGLLSFEVTKAEKAGKMIQPYPTKLPNALAKLALIQFDLLERFNEKRREISQAYFDGLKGLLPHQLIDPSKTPGAIFLRYPIRDAFPKKLLGKAKNEGIILGDWYNVPIAPPDVDVTMSGYHPGSNPHTELQCQQIINLPTYQNLKKRDIENIISLIKKHVNSKN